MVDLTSRELKLLFFVSSRVTLSQRDACRPFVTRGGGIIPYCATFTIFTDYMRGAIRIAALSQAGTIFVTTHDSIAVLGLHSFVSFLPFRLFLFHS